MDKIRRFNVFHPLVLGMTIIVLNAFWICRVGAVVSYTLGDVMFLGVISVLAAAICSHQTLMVSLFAGFMLLVSAFALSPLLAVEAETKSIFLPLFYTLVILMYIWEIWLISKEPSGMTLALLAANRLMLPVGVIVGAGVMMVTRDVAASICWGGMVLVGQAVLLRNYDDSARELREKEEDDAFFGRRSPFC